MLINVFNSKVNKKYKMVRQYVEIINVLLNLSTREMDVLALLMIIDLDWDNVRDKDILDSTSRKYIMKESLMNKANLSRYIALLKDKNAIVPEGDGWCVNKSILPIITNNEVKVNFNLKLDE